MRDHGSVRVAQVELVPIYKIGTQSLFASCKGADSCRFHSAACVRMAVGDYVLIGSGASQGRTGSNRAR